MIFYLNFIVKYVLFRFNNNQNDMYKDSKYKY